jgi:hypothetical protein
MSVTRSSRERGQVVVMFALMIPMLLALLGFVGGIGNWYVHAKHLQTKADAGAFAGGGEWQFPCGTDIDARIEATARSYAGATNPQVGRVPDTSIHPLLNAPGYYDDDEPVQPVENLALCNAMFLDVKVTEDNSFPLLSLIPLFPDIKRKARVEIRQGESFSGLLPIAVRAPEPVSAAVFYNEANGVIKSVRYFVKGSFGQPGNLQGWSTQNSEDGSLPAQFTPSPSTGVAIAISLRGACNTNLPSPNTKIVTSQAPCFEDEGFTDVNTLCNQGGASQVVECYFASGGTVQSGLHFIRGFEPTVGPGVGAGAPALRSAWLENIDCPSNGYFSSVPGTGTCEVRLTVKVDIGSKDENPPPNPPNTDVQTRTGQNTEVKYCLVLRGQTAANACSGQFSIAEEMQTSSGGPGEVTFTTVAGKHLEIPRNSQGAAVAIQVRMKDTTIAGFPGCDFVVNNDFNNNCRFFYTGGSADFTSTSVPPSGVAILDAPVQRSFRGNTVNSSSIRWLRLTTARGCTGSIYVDNEAASQPNTGDSCFFVEMGLKGGLALDVDEEPFVFNDGSGESQTGAVDCDPAFSGQGSDIRLATESGCSPFYARHPFDWTTPSPCPDQNSLFSVPTWPPGGDPDTPWPPLRCIKTRTTGNPSQFETGLDDRFFKWFDSSPNPGCPPDAAGFVKGRNYWDVSNNPLNAANLDPALRYGYKDDGPPARDTNFHPNDPRVVTIFLTTSDAYTSSGQETFEIAGFVQVYISGYGKLNGSGNLTVDDPCPGSTPPPVSEYDCSGSDCGYIVWGHFIKYSVPNPQATPTADVCNPQSTDPCVATLVE